MKKQTLEPLTNTDYPQIGYENVGADPGYLLAPRFVVCERHGRMLISKVRSASLLPKVCERLIIEADR